MSTKIIVGVDGGDPDDRAVAFAVKLSQLIGSCELVVAYVIEWSPYSFQTPEENEQRHKRREEEIEKAQSRVIEPLVKALAAKGISARGVVRHGHVADLLNTIAQQEGADQIVVARASATGLAARVFGSSTANLVMHASVPVTVVA